MGRSALSAFVVAASLVMADGVSAAGRAPEPELRITVRVDDKAGVQGAYLKFAKERAANVFAMRGVKLDWISGEDANRLKIVAPYMILIMAEAPARLKAEMEKLGTDVMGQGAPAIGRAYIYYDRVLKLNPVPPRDIITTLGDVMAHELGHLLLPPGHSNLGIMRPDINMTSRRLETFTDVEAAHIREHLVPAERDGNQVGGGFRRPTLRCERLPLLAQPRLEPLRAVAVAARPRLGAVLVTALGASVRVLNRIEVEKLLPVRALFLQRRPTEAGLDPFDAAVGELARLRHVAQVLVARD
jgi:hypothetical protein